ncbi:hypothetical protein D6745_00800 [Candidatus Woesearchaeota archaeon]|nr:MAG: hypothetical protein D6745_00800 [Candidatus Woesearchaeota archaeon]
MRIEINIDKKSVYFLMFVIVFGIVIAVTPNPGHNSDQIDFGRVVFNTEANWNGQNPQITNDGGTYDALMIVGKGSQPDRSVKLWDDLTVADDLKVNGDVHIVGNLQVDGSGTGVKVLTGTITVGANSVSPVIDISSAGFTQKPMIMAYFDGIASCGYDDGWTSCGFGIDNFGPSYTVTYGYTLRAITNTGFKIYNQEGYSKTFYWIAIGK